MIASAVALASVSALQASLVVVGSLQTEQGNPADWDPMNSTLVMTEASGVYTYTATGLSDGVLYEFKVLDNEGTLPTVWGDPEIVPVNTALWGDATGSSLITVNTNLTNNNGNAVVWITSNNAPLQAVGNFMVAAGGAADWVPQDPTFNMTPQGAGYFTLDTTISTPGTYEFKANDGTGATGWEHQVGPDGISNNAGTISFTTTSNNQPVTLFVDLTNQSIGAIVPEPSSAALLGLGGLALILRRRQ